MDSELAEILTKYDKVLYTTPDSFITPRFFSWRPREQLVIGSKRCCYSIMHDSVLAHVESELELFKGRKKINRPIASLSFFTDPKAFVALAESIVHYADFANRIIFHDPRFPATNFKEASQFISGNLAHMSVTFASDIAIKTLWTNQDIEKFHQEKTLVVIASGEPQKDAVVFRLAENKMDLESRFNWFLLNLTEDDVMKVKMHISNLQQCRQISPFGPKSGLDSFCNDCIIKGASDYIIRKHALFPSNPITNPK